MLTKGFDAPEVEAALVRAQTLCEQLGKTPDHLPILTAFWSFSFIRGELATARQVAERILRLAQRTPDLAWRGVAHANMQITLYFQGELTSARQHGEQAMAQFAIAPSVPLFLIHNFHPSVRSQVITASILYLLGYLDQARLQGQDALGSRESRNHLKGSR